MGVSTVESHLSHVYRKLGIRSRLAGSGPGARETEGRSRPSLGLSGVSGLRP